MKYPKGHEFEFVSLRPSQIRCDELYQRSLDTKRVDRIAAVFDGDTFNEPKVSYRDGAYWVFDGQHSIAAWRKIHDGADKPVMCKVFKGMTWVDECEAFVRQNGIAKDPTTNQKLRAAYNEKRPDVVSMVQGAQLVGFIVDFTLSKVDNRIVATNSLFRAYNRLGYQQYVDMLTAIKEAWNGCSDSLSQQIISGMTTFYATYAGNFRREDLVSSLRNTRPIDIIREGKGIVRGNGYAKEILKTYNVRRKSRRLPEDKL